MIVNNQEIKGQAFAYDGCHKIFILESLGDVEEALDYEYEIRPIKDIEKCFKSSCDLRFIYTWDGSKKYVKQFEQAIFS